MIRILFIFLLVPFFNSVASQGPVPTDYLSKEFHADRRNALRKIMPVNSVMVIFAYPERVFSRDINYLYHPNPDLYYFSGYKEPNAVLLIFKEDQHHGDSVYNELFFVRKRDTLQEQWTGRRLGVEGTKTQLGFKYVFNSDAFKDFSPVLTGFKEVIYDVLPDDIGSGALRSLYRSFLEKAGIEHPENKNISEAYAFIASRLDTSTLARFSNNLKKSMAASDDEVFKTDPILLKLVNHPDTSALASLVQQVKSHPSPSREFARLTESLREIKTPEELGLIRKSVFISAIAHREAMKAMGPDRSEAALSGIFEYVHKQYGAEGEGYPPIVGAGANGCILHYMENSVTRVENQLVLMDVASEYHGYSADITRTVPANGKFSAEQKAIYELVYDAQEEVFKLCREGTPFPKLNEKATGVLAAGLVKLGIISDIKEVQRYYLHGCSHHMGLDVHDKSAYGALKENMVITVEPGIYIPKGSPCDKKWWDIGVRIEDDVVIGKNGCANLSAAAPRKAEEVEKTLSEKSVFNEMALPKTKQE